MEMAELFSFVALRLHIMTKISHPLSLLEPLSVEAGINDCSNPMFIPTPQLITGSEEEAADPTMVVKTNSEKTNL